MLDAIPRRPDPRGVHAATLLRGPQGALFPTSGVYRILIEMQWAVGGVPNGLTGESGVTVTPAESRAHAAARGRPLPALLYRWSWSDR